MKHLRLILSLTLIVIITTSVYAQEEKDFSIQNYVAGNVHLKNMHLWRGIEVSDEVTATTDIYFKTKNDLFRAGIWNGMALNGNFKELDYYAMFRHSGFEASLWDIYNFSPEATYNNSEAFNYKARDTGHFFDLRLSYRCQGKIPLKIFWSTLLYGRDRDTLNERNRYSSYLELEYPVFYQNGFSLDVGVGGAFAIIRGKDIHGKKTNAHFYGEEPNIVDIHLRLSKTFKLGSYSLPVEIMPMWNPEKDYMNMEVSLQLLSF